MSIPLNAAFGWCMAAASGSAAASAWPLAMLGWGEMLIIGLVALLIFGKRLPEVARSLGKGVVEFKKGLRGIEAEVEQATSVPEPVRQTAVRELPSAVTEKPPIEPEKVSVSAEAPAAEAPASEA